jgi:hypothetical protein
VARGGNAQEHLCELVCTSALQHWLSDSDSKVGTPSKLLDFVSKKLNGCV